MEPLPQPDDHRQRRARLAWAIALISLGSCGLSWRIALAASNYSEPPYWVVWLTNRTLFNNAMAIVAAAILLLILLALWVRRGRRTWPALLIALGLVGACAASGWFFNFLFAGTYHEDSIHYQGTLYRLSFAVGGRGWWEVWRCERAPFDCQVIQEFSLSDMETEGAQYKDRPRFAVEGGQLTVTINGKRQIVVDTGDQ